MGRCCLIITHFPLHTSASQVMFLMPDFSLHYVATFGSDQRFTVGNAGDSVVRHREMDIVDKLIILLNSLPWRTRILLPILEQQSKRSRRRRTSLRRMGTSTADLSSLKKRSLKTGRSCWSFCVRKTSLKC